MSATVSAAHSPPVVDAAYTRPHAENRSDYVAPYQHSSLPHALRSMYVTLIPSSLSLPTPPLLFQEEYMPFHYPTVSNSIPQFLDITPPRQKRGPRFQFYGRQTYPRDHTSASTRACEREAVGGFDSSLLVPLKSGGRLWCGILLVEG